MQIQSASHLSKASFVSPVSRAAEVPAEEQVLFAEDLFETSELEARGLGEDVFEVEGAEGVGEVDDSADLRDVEPQQAAAVAEQPWQQLLTQVLQGVLALLQLVLARMAPTEPSDPSPTEPRSPEPSPVVTRPPAATPTQPAPVVTRPSQPEPNGPVPSTEPSEPPAPVVPRPPKGIDTPAPQPGGRVGGFETRKVGGSAGSFDRVYQYRGDDSKQPSFGGFAWGKKDVAGINRAGFNWFEVGYPDSLDPAEYQQLRDGGTRPIAYINMGEIVPDLKPRMGPAANTPVLRKNNDWNTQVVDVRDPRWQQWLIDRANYAYERGARGIKWDCAGIEREYKDPAAKEQALQAMAHVMRELKRQHPDIKHVLNQGFALAKRFPELVDGFETESLMSALDQGGGMAIWANEVFAELREIHGKYGIPVFMAEYGDPWSAKSDRWVKTITEMGFTPYITNHQWTEKGRGLNIAPGW